MQKHKTKISDILIFSIGVAIAILIGYLLALEGEPQAQWFFCETLNLCN